MKIMKLKLSLLFMAFIFSFVCYSQLSTRENTTSVFKTGSRPQTGSYGVYIGSSFAEIEDMINSDEFNAKGLPLINFKYYKSKNVEYRLGIQLSGKSTKIKGEENTSAAKEIKDMESVSYNRISLGKAYHYAPSNLLDVYTGVYIPFGWDYYKNEQTYGTTGQALSKFSPVIGLGAFIGLQAFIADLPVSVGFEYGLRALAQLGKQYKHVQTTTSSVTTYYTEQKSSAFEYSKLSYSESNIGTDARITFSYYFNK
jgi:hypothetical protein